VKHHNLKEKGQPILVNELRLMEEGFYEAEAVTSVINSIKIMRSILGVHLN
jgi:hypothetical protein